MATVDDQDRLLTDGDLAFAHNDHGQRTERRDGDEVTTYDYDELGNLLEVVLPDDTRVTYEVDPRGRRVLEQVDGVTRRGFLYQDGLNPVAELDASGAVTSVFLYATRPHAPDLIVRADATYRVVVDRLGSVRRVVDVTTGAVAQAIDYDSYGRVLSDSAPGFQPFGYAGGLYDPDTSLVRFGARDYDAEVGRWTAKDPILFGGRDANIYAYVLGDPINFIDPVGRWLVYAGLSFGGGIALGARVTVGVYWTGDHIGQVDERGFFVQVQALVGACVGASAQICGGGASNAKQFSGRSAEVGYAGSFGLFVPWSVSASAALSTSSPNRGLVSDGTVEGCVGVGFDANVVGAPFVGSNYTVTVPVASDELSLSGFFQNAGKLWEGFGDAVNAVFNDAIN